MKYNTIKSVFTDAYTLSHRPLFDPYLHFVSPTAFFRSTIWALALLLCPSVSGLDRARLTWTPFVRNAAKGGAGNWKEIEFIHPPIPDEPQSKKILHQIALPHYLEVFPIHFGNIFLLYKLIILTFFSPASLSMTAPGAQLSAICTLPDALNCWDRLMRRR
ncbi:hypothetical protein QW131_15325 [Roseibium salinum]|nr:hypothetical protein [Roseibium salinum]